MISEGKIVAHGLSSSRRSFLAPVSAALLTIGLSADLAHGGLSRSAIKGAWHYSTERKGLGLIVWEQGKIRFEKYYNGHGADEPVHIFSGVKSLFGALSAFAAEDGLLSLDEPVSQTIPEWRNDSRKSRITIRELLNFTSGLDTGFEEIYGRDSADKLTVSIGLKAKREPGSAFIYGPGNIQVFGEVLRRKLKPRGETYLQYLHRRLLDPLDIHYSKWREDDHGNVHLSAGAHLTGRDWLKFGIFLVRGGQWGERQLVPTARLAECFRGTEINPAYGLNFWLNSHAPAPDAREVDVEERLEEEPLPEDWRGACLCKDAPPDLIAALGSKNQRLYIVPSMQVVVVHQGDDGGFTDADFLRLLFRP